MLSSENLIELYTRYGFEQGHSSDQYLVFFSQKGYFQNAEIVLLKEDMKPEKVDKTEYEEMGYSVRVRSFKDVAAVHDALYGNIITFVNINKINFLEVNMNMWLVILLKTD